LKTRSRKVVTILVSIVVVIMTISHIGTLPVHRVTVSHTDELGDISDPNTDIVSYQSYPENNFIILELVVAGNIISDPESKIGWTSNYLYHLIVVARSVGDKESHIYSCSFQDGIVGQYFLDTEVENDTLRIFFPLSQFLHGSYMTGLEAKAHSNYGVDYGVSDRNAEIQLLLL